MRGKAGKYEERFEVVREYYTVLLTGPTRGRESIKNKKKRVLDSSHFIGTLVLV